MEEKRKDEFGERMKAYEASTETHLNPALPFVCRLDGHCFSQFTRIFQKPFDLRITKAMAATCADLMKNFNPRFIFTQSDEITMVFPPTSLGKTGEPEKMMFDGRVEKLVSLTAGYCSARFNYHLARFANTAKSPVISAAPAAPAPATATAPLEQNSKEAAQIARALSGTAFFDSRIFNVPNMLEAANAVLWRCHDCIKNSVAMLAQAHVPHKLLVGVPREGQLALLEERGVSWERDLPPYWKYGLLFKRMQYLLPSRNPTTGQSTLALRTRVQARSARVSFADGLADLVVAKYWNVPMALPGEEVAPEPPMAGGLVVDAARAALLGETFAPVLEEEFDPAKGAAPAPGTGAVPPAEGEADAE
ncbi:putative tRNAHis guanylyltransferase [Paratrimastix pyriformis]|uniref:tRNAHis guanylyltransferase n=1 Tax=Paratrimastix pyriformis TaxID=342808 RepID=A0ABQ8UR26_9EUKA|nr:putative tRNAHis guanylyltransferase [Paratrimastix pyriformis]|eukprot:GAFH01002410.1.p1 GENE.GAFH01002410.1~~GAFH01002410.1.p1  ORF type:complete len:373 (+),score=96.35 GAFH01002410.1:33-1121(+)